MSVPGSGELERLSDGRNQRLEAEGRLEEFGHSAGCGGLAVHEERALRGRQVGEPAGDLAAVGMAREGVDPPHRGPHGDVTAVDAEHVGAVDEGAAAGAGRLEARHEHGRLRVGEPLGEAGFIQILGVDPDHWRRGIAAKMLNALLERCQSKGLKTVQIMLNEHDSQLQGFFKRMGFHRGNLIDFQKTL